MVIKRKNLTEMENHQISDELRDVVHFGKKRITPTMILDFSSPACLQNLTCNFEWRKGDPNPHTTPHYDFVWLLWVLRQVFPKDIVTHMMNIVGGMTFFYQRHSYHFNNFSSAYNDGVDYEVEEKMELDFFPKRMNMNQMRSRRLYLNISVDKIVFEKGKVYLWYKDGKRYYLDTNTL